MYENSKNGKIIKSDEEWLSQLTPEQYRVTRERGTEPPFTGPHLDEHSSGIYKCVCCDAPLFTSSEKFDSGTGWPSFYDQIGHSIEKVEDNSRGMRRIEIRCARCQAHLGHVFPDGPQPTGLRYCTNGQALVFEPKQNV